MLLLARNGRAFVVIIIRLNHEFHLIRYVVVVDLAGVVRLETSGINAAPFWALCEAEGISTMRKKPIVNIVPVCLTVERSSRHPHGQASAQTASPRRRR
jgi:hypothetical protein